MDLITARRMSKSRAWAVRCVAAACVATVCVPAASVGGLELERCQHVVNNMGRALIKRDYALARRYLLYEPGEASSIRTKVLAWAFSALPIYLVNATSARGKNRAASGECAFVIGCVRVETSVARGSTVVRRISHESSDRLSHECSLNMLGLGSYLSSGYADLDDALVQFEQLFGGTKCPASDLPGIESSYSAIEGGVLLDSDEYRGSVFVFDNWVGVPSHPYLANVVRVVPSAGESSLIQIHIGEELSNGSIQYKDLETGERLLRAYFNR